MADISTEGINVPALQKTMELYCALMTEIKYRIDGMNAIAHAGLPVRISYEACYLQLRLICESIAIGCLVVNGDILTSKSSKLAKTWEADRLIYRLSEIHPAFYPEPVEPDGGNRHKLAKVSAPVLSKDELIALYRRCGGKLHRGALKDLHRSFESPNLSFVQIQASRDKIVHLLQHHWISVFNSSDKIGVQMGGPNAAPTWSYWRAVGTEP